MRSEEGKMYVDFSGYYLIEIEKLFLEEPHLKNIDPQN